MALSAGNLLALAKLSSRLGLVSRVVNATITPSVNKAADDLVDRMKELAPKDTGALAESIVATPAGEQTPDNALGGSQTVSKGHVVITAGNREVFYAAMVEHGTSKAEAKPFFYPAYREMHGKLKADITTAVVKAALS